MSDAWSIGADCPIVGLCFGRLSKLQLLECASSCSIAHFRYLEMADAPRLRI